MDLNRQTLALYLKNNKRDLKSLIHTDTHLTSKELNKWTLAPKHTQNKNLSQYHWHSVLDQSTLQSHTHTHTHTHTHSKDPPNIHSYLCYLQNIVKGPPTLTDIKITYRTLVKGLPIHTHTHTHTLTDIKTSHRALVKGLPIHTHTHTHTHTHSLTLKPVTGKRTSPTHCLRHHLQNTHKRRTQVKRSSALIVTDIFNTAEGRRPQSATHIQRASYTLTLQPHTGERGQLSG